VRFNLKLSDGVRFPRTQLRGVLGVGAGAVDPPFEDLFRPAMVDRGDVRVVARLLDEDPVVALLER